MDIQEIHKKLDKQCPSDYKINEIIQFAYPYRRVRVNATVNKSPEKSIQQVGPTLHTRYIFEKNVTKCR